MKSLKLHQLLAAMVLVFAASLSVGLESAEAHHSARKVSAIESATLGCVNRQRVRAGLFPVGMDRSLARAARFHSRNMARFEFFDHTDPAAREPWDRVALFDPRPWNVGENIGAGYRWSGEVCRGWMDSTGHRENILDPTWTYGAVGYVHSRHGYRHYWTLLLGSLAPAPEEPSAGLEEDR